MGWTVRVDEGLCQGHGVCESEASAVFTLAHRARTVTIVDAHPGDDQRAAVDAAVKYCPTHALRIDETGVEESD